ncbi:MULTISPECIES: PRD domain-containing protein [Priestia]|uniref:PRD domain-containing protein n=1 Tax=Priestia TaxID=2800373 RepID=UPI001ADA707A|nr:MULTISPECIES: PRD domain-containing protein [Priestia]MDN3233161.1 PRD domain-containing protein [Priestia megaterium]QTL52351.1 PRD domain-containing protein [Priestia aryabhattai]
MRVTKKINNNVVLAVNDKGEEIFVVGKGLGFLKTPYNLEDSSEKIEKVFVQNDNLKFNMLFNSIPSDVILVTENIISEGKKHLGTNLNDGMLIALSDHINTALKRNIEGEELVNSYQWEMKHIYPTEASFGFKALNIIRDKLGVQLPESEASFIALHFVNGQLNSNDFTETAKLNKIIKDILNIIKYHYQVNINEQSINYSRFVTHVRYFLLRLMNNETLNQENGDLFEVIKSDASEELKCIDKIDKYLKDNYNWVFPKNEKIYLILHLQRVMRNL